MNLIEIFMLGFVIWFLCKVCVDNNLIYVWLYVVIFFLWMCFIFVYILCGFYKKFGLMGYIF